MAKSSSRRRIPIPIIVAIVTATGAIIVAALNLLLPQLLNPNPTEVSVTAHVADKDSEASVPGAKVLLLFDGGAFAEYTDGNGITSFKVTPPSRSDARVFVESDRHEIHDETIQLSSNQSIDIRLTPKGSNDRRVIVRVVDNNDGMPLDGAQVVLLVGGNSLSQSTDSNGIAKFTITFSSDTIDADISVSTQNYNIERQRVTLRPDEVQDVRLNRDANELTVTAFEPSAPAPSDSSSPKLISFGQILTGAITAPTEFDIYIFTANANDLVVIRIAKLSGNLCPQMRLLRPDRTEMTRVRSNCVSGELSETLPVSGDYRLIIEDSDGTRTGEYNLNLQKIE